MSQKLKDVQNQDDKRGIDLQKVGIKDFEVPLIIQRKNADNQIVSAKVKMNVSLPKNFKGTHMSRFVEVLNDWRKKELLGMDIKGCLKDIQKKLHSESAELKFSFKYFIEKQAPVSKLVSTLGYDCFFEGILHENDYEFILGVKVPVTTLCPCSKEISDFSAHNQRAVVKVKITYDEGKHIWIEDLIEMIEKCGSAPVYPLLKRSDEKFVTELAYKNPKFVEDVLREVITVFEINSVIKNYEIETEAFESIHNHSAWAYHKK